MMKLFGRKRCIAIMMVVIMLFTLIPVDLNWADDATAIIAQESTEEIVIESTEVLSEDNQEKAMEASETVTTEASENAQMAVELAENDQSVGDTVDAATTENTTEKTSSDNKKLEPKQKDAAVQKAENQTLNVTDSSVSVNGTTLTTTSSTQVKNGDKIDIKVEWSIPNSVNDRNPDYVYEYNLDAIGVALSDVKDGSVFRNGVEVGKYSITAGLLTIQITDTQFLKESELTGYVNLEGVVNIDEDAINDEGESTISIANKTYDVTVESADSDTGSVSVSKVANGKSENEDGNNTIQSFKIIIQSKGDNTNVNINDIAGSNLSLVSGSVHVSGDNDAGSVTYSDNSFSYEVASMTDGQEIVITYDMEIADAAYAGNLDWSTVNNKVDYTYVNDEGEMQDPWEPSVNANMTTPSLSKKGSYDASEKAVTWTVDIYGNDLDLAGTSVTDTLGEHLSAGTGNATIQYYSNDWQLFDTDTISVSDFINSGYTIQDKNQDIKYVRITYQTKVDSDYTINLVDKTVDNTIETVFDEGVTYSKVGTATIGKTQIVSKSCETVADTVQSNDDLIQWKTVIVVPAGGLEDLVYTDTIGENHALEGNVTVTGATAQSINTDTANNRFTVTFGDVANSGSTPIEIVITYATKPSNITEDLVEYVYNNDAQASFTVDDATTTQSANAKYELEKTNIISKDSAPWWFTDSIYTKEKDELKWSVKVDLSAFSDASEIDTLVITDTMPEGMTIKDGYVWTVPTDSAWDGSQFTQNPDGISVTANGNVVAFDITTYAKAILNGASAQKTFYIGYITEFESFDDYLQYAGSYVTNAVEVKNGDTFMGKASASQNVESIDDVIDKIGVYSESTAPYVEYTIEINKDKIDMLEDGDELVVTDVMGSALSLVPSSVVVYQEDAVTELEESKYEVTYDVATNTIKTVIPDATHLYIKYKAKIDLEVGTDMSSHDTTNKVSIEGFTSTKSMSATQINGTVLESSAGATSITGSVVIYKYNQNITNHLEGAYFTVWMVEYDEATGEFVPAPINESIGYSGPTTISTGTNGQSSINGLVYDRIYAIKETRAPAGYAVNQDTFYFIIKGSEGKELPTGTKNFLTSGQIMYVEDKVATEGYFAISKRKTGTTTELSGATLELYAHNGTDYETTPLLSFESQNAPTTITVVSDGTTPDKDLFEIAPGSYKLVETKAPEGYEIATEITFDVAADGTIDNVVGGTLVSDSNTLVMYDDVVSIDIEKRKNSLTGDYLSGAELTLTDSEGNVVETVTTGNGPTTITELIAGGTYTLTETKTPTGYETAAPIVFTVDSAGNITRADGISVTDNTVVMVDTLKETSMTISKQIVNTDTELAGATLKLYKNNKSSVAIKEWTTTSTPQEFTIKLDGDITLNEIAPGDYILEEFAPPAGYTYSEDISFTVTEDGEVLIGNVAVTDNKVVMVDTPFSLYLMKRDMSSNLPLKDAVFTLYKVNEGADDTIVTTWTSTDAALNVSGEDLEIGATYRLEETTPPSLNKDGLIFEYIAMQDVYFTILENGGVQILTGANQTSANRIGVDVQVGKYDDTASVNNQITLYNKVITPSNFLISKRETGSTSELAGVTLELYKSDGTQIATWVTGDAPKSIWVFNDTTTMDSFVVPGQEIVKILEGSYYLLETSMPIGYKKIVKHSFDVSTSYDTTTQMGIVKIDNITTEDGSQSVLQAVANNSVVNGEYGEDLVVYNTMKTVKISKTAIAGGDELPGATIEIFKKDTNGEYVTTGIKWKSEATAKEIDLGDLGEGEFKLVENSAPNGYAYTEDIEFTISIEASTGEAVVKNNAGTVTEHLEMVDDALALSIQKVDENGSALSGATFVLKDSNGAQIDTWISNGNAHPVTNTLLVAGETYTLSETEAPKGYTVMDDVTFTVNRDGSITLISAANASFDAATKTITAKNKAITLAIMKENVSGKRLAGALMVLNDSQGNPIVEETTNANGEFVLDADAIQKLKVDETYTLIEKSAPTGYAIAQPIVFTIDEEGNVTRKDGQAVVDNTIVMVDEEVGITFLKADEHGTPIAGAYLRVEAVELNDGFTPVEWESTTIPFSISGSKFTPGNRYRMTEITAPNGYKYTTDVIFTYSSSGTIYLTGESNNAVVTSTQLTMVDEVLDLYVSKSDLTGTNELAGAVMKIVNATTGEEVDSWISTTIPHEIKKDKLVAGQTYTLIEEIAPQGYTVTTDITFTVAKDGTISTTGTNVIVGDYNGSTDNLLTMLDDTIDLKIAKVDEESNYLAGATLELREKASNALVATIEGDGKPIQIPYTKLKGNTVYVLAETKAPAGYAISDSIEFTITAKGEIKRADDGAVNDNTVVMIDYEVGVLITKEDLGGNTLPGATLKITSTEDTDFSMDSWVSTNTPKNIQLDKFKVDTEYILTETIAPQGYSCTESIVFKVDSNGDIYVKSGDTFVKVEDSTITMKDAPLVLNVSKRIKGTIKPLAGATLSIVDEITGEDVYSYVSGTEAEQIPSIYLTAGAGTELKKYILTEIVAPNGYALAEDIYFAIDSKGNVYYKNGEGDYVTAADNTLVMYDEPSSIIISKQDANGTSLQGATLTITSIVDTTFTPVSWVSGAGVKELDVKQFKRNVDYILTENAAPKGYAYAASITFQVDENGNVQIDGKAVDNNQIVMVDEEIQLLVSKKDEETDDHLAKAKLSIEEEKSGKVIFQWTTKKKVEKIAVSKLQASTETEKVVYVLKEKKAPKGYELAEDIRFYIASNGDVYVIEEDGTETLMADDTITMYDVAIEEEDEEDDDTGVKTKTKKTGDMTPIGGVAILFVIALVGFISLFLIRRRRNEYQ